MKGSDDELLANCMEDGLLQAQDMKGALEVFRDMQGRNMRISKVAWCYMISSLNRVLKRKGWPYAEAAYQLWEELQKQDFSPQDSKDAQYYVAGMLSPLDTTQMTRECLEGGKGLGGFAIPTLQR